MKRSLWRAALLLTAVLLFPRSSSAESEYYRLTLVDDPATTMNIGWCSTRDLAASDPSQFTVYYDTVDYGTDYAAYGMNQLAEVEYTSASLVHMHTILRNLQPKTVYYFVIRDNVDGHVSPRISFMTLSDSPDDPLTIISGGDSRNGVEPIEVCYSQGCRALRQKGNKLVAKIRPDVIFFNGDFTLTEGGNAGEWRRWFEDWQLTRSPDGRMYPLVVSHGNHEDIEVVQRHFNLEYEYIYYALNFHGNLLRLYTLRNVLDSGAGEEDLADIPGQEDWFQEQLDLNDGMFYWNTAQFHVPMFPQGHYFYRPDIAEMFFPRFEEYDFRLVMESHTHIHKVTYPIVMSDKFNEPGGAVPNEDRFERNDDRGVTFVGEGNWGAPFRKYTNQQYPWTKEMGGNPGSRQKWGSFFHIRVNKERMHIITVILENEDEVEQLFDNELGSCLPAGITYFDESYGNTTGELELKLCRTGTACLSDTSFDCGVLTAANEHIADDPTLRTFSTVYPVPAVKSVTIDFDAESTGLVKDAEIFIYDALGHRCRNVDVARGDGSIEVDVTELCRGVNYIYIRTPEGIQSHKIIKQ